MKKDSGPRRTEDRTRTEMQTTARFPVCAGTDLDTGGLQFFSVFFYSQLANYSGKT